MMRRSFSLENSMHGFGMSSVPSWGMGMFCGIINDMIYSANSINEL